MNFPAPWGTPFTGARLRLRPNDDLGKTTFCQDLSPDPFLLYVPKTLNGRRLYRHKT